MRLLITGASGLLGLNVALDASQVHQVTAIDRRGLTRTPFEIVRADLLEPNSIETALDAAKPEAVIHCAALADVDSCEKEPELAARTNAELPGRIADACRRHSVRMLHVSTDAVFDGRKSGLYAETDSPNPLSTYARTKYAGEGAVLSLHPGAIVARVNFYGWSMSGRRSLAEFFVANLAAGKMVNGFTDVTFCPMLVNHLASILMAMLQTELHGLYHVAGPSPMTKYEFGVEIARCFGFDERQIQPRLVEQSDLVARRGHNLSLSIHKLSTDLGVRVPQFSTGLSLFHAQYQSDYPLKLRSYQQTAAEGPGGTGRMA